MPWRYVRMELILLAFIVFAVWQMAGGFPLEPAGRTILAVVCIACEIVIAVVSMGLVRLH